MKKLLFILILTSFVFGQQTQPANKDKKEPKLPVEFYFNGKNEKTKTAIEQLTKGMRYQDKIELILKDVSLNPDHAAFVNAQVAKLPLDQQRYIDIVVIVGNLIPLVEGEKQEKFFEKNTMLFGGVHIANYLNQAILYKLGMGVEKPPYYTKVVVPPNPIDELKKSMADIESESYGQYADLYNQLIAVIVMLGLLLAKICGLHKIVLVIIDKVKGILKERKELKKELEAFRAGKDTSNPGSYAQAEKLLKEEIKKEQD